jgi:hypothetical protein
MLKRSNLPPAEEEVATVTQKDPLGEGWFGGVAGVSLRLVLRPTPEEAAAAALAYFRSNYRRVLGTWQHK